MRAYILIIWLTDLEKPSLPTSQLERFNLLQTNIVCATQQALIDSEDLTTRYGGINFIPFDDENIDRDILNYVRLLISNGWFSMASDVLRVHFLQASTKPMLYLDIKAVPQSQDALQSTWEQANKSKTIKNNMLIDGPEGDRNYLGGRNNIHFTPATKKAERIYGLALNMLKYLLDLFYLFYIRKKYSSDYYHLVIMITGNAIAIALNQNTTVSDRKNISKSIDEDLLLGARNSNTADNPRQLSLAISELDRYLFYIGRKGVADTFDTLYGTLMNSDKDKHYQNILRAPGPWIDRFVFDPGKGCC